ncbi:MAG: YitT family protein [Ruminococcaceae bacterium]|nr:YitT family protein [Oscillospiraceae bacterium]
MNKSQKVLSYVWIVAVAILLALNYHIFIVQNHFAPAGLNGIATMVQYKTGFSISYMSLLINIPLSIFAYFFIKKSFATKTLLFTLVYSFAFLLLQNSGLEFIQYNADGHDTIYPVIISGVISGVVYGICFKNSASTGGTDVVARYINKVKPDTNFFIVTFSLNTVVAISSLFVYSESSVDYKPVALCITYCFISTYVGNYIIKGTKTAYKFTVVTTHPDEISKEISALLKHSSTKVTATGTYTNTEKWVLICVVNKHQLTDFQSIIAKYDDTFSFYELINETYGNFVHVK